MRGREPRLSRTQGKALQALRDYRGEIRWAYEFGGLRPVFLLSDAPAHVYARLAAQTVRSLRTLGLLAFDETPGLNNVDEIHLTPAGWARIDYRHNVKANA